jgi:protein-S-isoprenylcysteine O-methyltransferase Ste14
MNRHTSAIFFVTAFVVIRQAARLATHRGPRGERRGPVVERHVDLREALSMGLFVLGGLILPLISLGPWLSSLDYTVPDWVSWLGVAIMAGAGLLHWRAHADLGRNYSMTVLLRERQSLVTDGVYAWIRHPIYASLWLIVIAQPLLVHHWICGFSGLPTFAVLFFHRLRREEGMMIDAFGEQYRDYMRRVGGVIPRRSRS